MDKPVVLVVEDEAVIASMVEMTFEDAGFLVHLAANAVEAMAQISELDGLLCALVTDIRLGQGANGWAVATDARMQLPYLPVVYMTGDSAADWSAMGVPMSVLVQKPFVGAQVLAAVMTLMNSDNGSASAG